MFFYSNERQRGRIWWWGQGNVARPSCAAQFMIFFFPNLIFFLHLLSAISISISSWLFLWAYLCAKQKKGFKGICVYLQIFPCKQTTQFSTIWNIFIWLQMMLKRKVLFIMPNSCLDKNSDNRNEVNAIWCKHFILTILFWLQCFILQNKWSICLFVLSILMKAAQFAKLRVSNRRNSKGKIHLGFQKRNMLPFYQYCFLI